MSLFPKGRVPSPPEWHPNERDAYEKEMHNLGVEPYPKLALFPPWQPIEMVPKGDAIFTGPPTPGPPDA
jgi:hypothetical protein